MLQKIPVFKTKKSVFDIGVRLNEKENYSISSIYY